MADFFTSLFGFPEQTYDATRERLLQMATFETVDRIRHYHAETCTFRRDDDAVAAGIFSFPSVQELRNRVQEAVTTNNNDSGSRKRTGQIRIQNVAGEARSLHMSVDNAGAVVQAASQFNLLEFPSARSTPENGISGYVYDGTQGPACAMACAAGTAYRNYLVPVPFGPLKGNSTTARGQTRKNQLNGLEDIESYLIQETPLEVIPWKVRNGYIESSPQLLTPLNELLNSNSITADKAHSFSPLEEALMARLRIGVQEHTTVTDDPDFRQTVTQTYNSAVSIGYSRLPTGAWEPLARLVLRATYEATLLVGVLATIEQQQQAMANGAAPSQPPPILLTKVGGGVFANKDEWIADAIEQAVKRVSVYGVDLDVKIVHFGAVAVDDEYSHLPSWSENNSFQSEL